MDEISNYANRNIDRKKDIESYLSKLSRNSNITLLIAIIAFFLSFFLYIFFVILPLRRTEQKVEKATEKVVETTRKVEKVANDVENLIQDVRNLSQSVENRFNQVENFICNNQEIFCQTIGSDLGIDTQNCEQITNTICNFINENNT